MIKSIKNILVIAVLILLVGYILFQKNNITQAEEMYKRVLISKDSLIKVREDLYKKLVDDTYSNRELLQKLAEDNKKLYKELKVSKKKIVSYTKVVAKPTPKEKVDTVYLEKGASLITFLDYYPSKQNPFITYKGEIKGDKLLGSFTLEELQIGVVVTETQPNLFEAHLVAPAWLEVSDLQVNSLPLKGVVKNDFDWVYGGAAGLGIGSNTLLFEVEAGFRFKDIIYSISGNTDKELMIGVKKLF